MELPRSSAPAGLRRRRVLSLLGLALLAGPAPATDGDAARWTVVVDPGHGGADYGARGSSGLREKGIVLEVSQRLGRALRGQGLRVVYTRQSDRFVALPERTEIANRAGGDLYLSIHANASEDPKARGFETYFLSLEASDDEARRVATLENGVFDRPDAVPDSGDLVGAILGDLIRTEHLRASSRLAAAIQRELDPLGISRGVKQAPFVVLMGVNMPAALLEIGFLTHPREEDILRSPAHQRAIARAIARAVSSLERAARRAPASSDSSDSSEEVQP